MEDKIRHPAHLKGREIGIFYRNLSIQKKKEKAGSSTSLNSTSLNKTSLNKTLNTNYFNPSSVGKTIGRINRLKMEKFMKAKDKETEPTKEIIMGSSITLPDKIITEINTILEKKYEDSNIDFSSFKNKYLLTLQMNFEDFMLLNAEKIRKQNISFSVDENFFKMCDLHAMDSIYMEREKARQNLPVFEKREEILKMISQNQAILISGDTGCGKTTQVPQFILEQAIAVRDYNCNIICTQPRRISAITAAERVAWERNEPIGNSVGYHIRLQCVPPRFYGSIIYCTTGVLLRRMQLDPLLFGISHIILDEIHERTVETDIILGLLKHVVNYRKNIKVILMSATFNMNAFSTYFYNCPSITISGRLYPVEVFYLEDILEEIKCKIFLNKKKSKKNQWYTKQIAQKEEEFKAFIEPYAKSVQDKYSPFVIESIQNFDSENLDIEFIVELILYVSLNKPDGAILVFLPGYDAISKLYNELNKTKEFKSSKYQIHPLHSMMPTVNQKSIFIIPQPGIRKIILATNIAETSITIEDVVYVINAGRIKQTEYDSEKNLQMLEEKWAPLANSAQRKGRAGRVGPGVCYNLYTRGREKLLDSYQLPEILRSKLDSVILCIKMLHIHSVQNFFSSLLDVPNDSVLKNSITLLKRINALDVEEYITPLGLHLAHMPVDPQAGKMILLAALFKCIDPITSVAASLSFRDAFYKPLGQEKLVDKVKKKFSFDSKSDHLMMAEVICKVREAKTWGHEQNFCYENFLSLSTLNQLERIKIQFCELLQDAKFLTSSDSLADNSNINSLNKNILRAIVCAGLYPNMAYLRKVKTIKNRVEPILSFCTPEDGKVHIHKSSVNCADRHFESKFFVYFMKQKSSAIYLYDTTMVSPLSLLIFGDGITTGSTAHGQHYISVADVYRFPCNKQTSKLILELRQGLENLLEKISLYPHPINLCSNEGNMLRGIIHLLSCEENGELEVD